MYRAVRERSAVRCPETAGTERPIGSTTAGFCLVNDHSRLDLPFDAKVAKYSFCESTGGCVRCNPRPLRRSIGRLVLGGGAREPQPCHPDFLEDVLDRSRAHDPLETDTRSERWTGSVFCVQRVAAEFERSSPSGQFSAPARDAVGGDGPHQDGIRSGAVLKQTIPRVVRTYWAIDAIRPAMLSQIDVELAGT